MDMNATVMVEDVDSLGNVWRVHTSHMVRTNVERCIDAVREGYNMDRTRITVDGKVVFEPRQR